MHATPIFGEFVDSAETLKGCISETIEIIMLKFGTVDCSIESYKFAYTANSLTSWSSIYFFLDLLENTSKNVGKNLIDKNTKINSP